MTPEERTAYYRWEFPKWRDVGYQTCLDCPGSTTIETNRRAEWVCSSCARDVSIEAVLMYQALNPI